jgi:hypothetical protein
LGKTKIEWTGDHGYTWNPIKARTLKAIELEPRPDVFKLIPAGKVGFHCEKISPG